MLRKLLTFVLLCFVGVSYGYAQSGGIRGTVTDAKTGDTLPGTNVYIKSLQRGTSANNNGKFSINNIPSGTYTVNFTFVGYKILKRNIEVGDNVTTVNVSLKRSNSQLGETVVTGFGEVSRQAFTGSAPTIEAEDLQDAPVSSVVEALQGKAAGANITASSGLPGSVQQIRVRGISSINAGTSPLYVIDGVPINGGSTTSFTGTGSLGQLSALSQSDIESVTVLKSASATAVYGARGANGVIVIKTKQGLRNSKTQYTVSAQTGFNSPAVSPPDVMNTEQINEYAKAATGLSLPDIGQAINRNLGSLDTDTNWEDLIHNDHAAQRKYGLSARGGNDKTTFYAAGNYFKQEGQTKGGQLNRISGKLNVEHDLDSRFTIKNNFTGSYVKQSRFLQGSGAFGNPILDQFFLLPTYKAYDDNGNINRDIPGIFNPLYTRENDIDRALNYRLINNTTLTLDIFDNLTAKTNFAVDFREGEEKSYDNPVYGDGASTNGRVDEINNRTFNYVWKNTIKYIGSINQNNTITARAISSSQRNYYRFLEGYATGVASSNLYNLNTTASPKGTGGATTDWAVQTFSGLVNYNFSDKFYVDASITEEGNSRFSPDERWGTFYSLGASYVLTEDLIPDLNWLNNLRVHVSLGKTGNSAINLNQYQAKVGFGSYANQPVVYTSTLGNGNLSWENNMKYEAGLNFKFIDRISGSLTVYRNNSTDLLFDVPLSRTTGFTSQTKNNGELYNEGIEVNLSGQIIRTQNIAWTLGGNFTFNKNEVTNLPKSPTGDNITNISGTKYIAQVGYPTGSWYMRKWAGVDPENGDPLWYKDDGNGGRTTTNNYNEADKYYLDASPQAKQYGGINTRVDVFGFYASANLYYAFGNKVYDNWARYLRADGARNGIYNQYESQTDYWKEPGDHAKNPKPVSGGNLNSTGTSSRYLYDGDFLRLKTLRVGYNIPTRYLSKVGLSDVQVYFLGRNLWTHKFDDDLELDPEVGNDGFTELRPGVLKSVTFGLNIKF